MTAPKGLLTASRLSTWSRCQQMHEYSYELGWRSQPTAKMKAGTIVHSLIESYWKARRSQENFNLDAHLPPAYDFEGEIIVERARVLMKEYLATWSDPEAIFAGMYSEERDGPLVVLSVEGAFQMPLTRGLSKGDRRKHPSFNLAGKMDLVLGVGKLVFLVEHKTTTRDTSPGSSYWERLILEHQVSAYLLACNQQFGRVDGFVYDVLRTPTIEPRQATPVMQRKYTKEGKLYANQREIPEGVAEFRERLEEWAAEQRAQSAPICKPTVSGYDSYRLDQFLHSAYSAASQITDTRRRGLVVKNTNECFTYGRCAYFEKCAHGTPLTSIPGLSRSEVVHPELIEKEEQC